MKSFVNRATELESDSYTKEKPDYMTFAHLITIMLKGMTSTKGAKPAKMLQRMKIEAKMSVLNEGEDIDLEDAEYAELKAAYEDFDFAVESIGILRLGVEFGVNDREEVEALAASMEAVEALKSEPAE